MKKLLISLAFFTFFSAYAQIGEWKLDDNDLPKYLYLDELPYESPNTVIYDQAVHFGEDPFFLLGNYKIKLFTHVSGAFRIISGQRSWMCMNQGNEVESGINEAFIENLTDKTKTPLVGINSISADPELCTREFGVGYAKYNYTVGNDYKVSRTIMVLPSKNINSGIPAFAIQVKIKNISNKTLTTRYLESFLANPVMLREQNSKPENRNAQFKQSVTKRDNFLIASFAPSNKIPHYIKSVEDLSLYDYYPPSVFCANLSQVGENKTSEVNLQDRYSMEMTTNLEIRPGEEVEFTYLIGIRFDEDINTIIEGYKTLVNAKVPLKTLATEWKNILPDMDKEKDPVFHREMLWNAHALEALASYNRYFEETFIPQGTIYTFVKGFNAAVRDHLQHALGVIYYNPALAKSIIRTALKHIRMDGEIVRTDLGYGCESVDWFLQSDSQLYLMDVLSEYLRITGDYDLLFEAVAFYPKELNKEEIVLDRLVRTMDFFHQNIGVGPNGLIKLKLTDWDDSFYTEELTEIYVGNSESHLNTTIGLNAFRGMIKNFDNVIASGKYTVHEKTVADFKNNLETFESQLTKSFYEDLGSRAFSARAYFNSFGGKQFGMNDMYIEPQGFLLQLSDFPVERKEILLSEIENRLIKPEAFAGRHREKPREYSDVLKRKAIIYPGYAANGGIWFATYTPVVVGAATFDKEKAKELLHRMTWARYAEKYPQYWNQWSAPDCFISSIGDSPGAPYQQCPVYNAHGHAWALYAYFKINEK